MSTYCFSDIHGNYNLWKQVKEYLKPEDKVYFLGDAFDKGNDGVQILLEMLADSRFTLLRGNHEQFLLDNFKKLSTPYFEKESFWSLFNGGSATIKYLKNRMSASECAQLYNKIKEMPLYTCVTNNKNQLFILSHSGFNPWLTEQDEKIFYGSTIEERYMWNRDHIINRKWVYDEDTYMVHGHTPTDVALEDYFGIPMTEEHKNETLFYCQNHKIDIDLGCFYSHRTCLFNIDTFESIYFEETADEE